MATYSTIPAAEEPLVAKPQGKSLKALVAGAAVASFALGALAATAVSASVAAPKASFIKPMYVFNQKLGVMSFKECEAGCKEISGNGFKKGQMTIPCITSFDMNAQLLAWVQGKTGGKDKGEKNFVWIGHKTEPGSEEGEWVPKGCETMQKRQSRGDMVCRNGCAFAGDADKPACTGSDLETCGFDDPNEPSAVGCAVLVNVRTEAGAASMNLPPGPISSYDELHGNWIKSQDCKYADIDAFGNKEPVHCICQKTQA